MKHNKIYLFTLLLAGMLALATIAQERVVNIYRNGEVIQSYAVTEIDSLKVEKVLSAPGNVRATLDGETVVVTWDVVAEAQFYEVYRSSDNVTYTILSADVTETNYIDATPQNGNNYYKVRAIGESLSSDYSTASNAISYTVEELASGLYLGVTGFNQALYNYPLQLLDSETQSGFNNFINELTAKNGTVLYYSVDEAISTLQGCRFPDDLFNVAIVTFTDGLDKGSMMLNSNYESDEEYLSAVNSRIVNEKVSSQEISAYSIGIRGDDVSDVAKFNANLQQLASSPSNAFEVSSMNEVNTKFEEIAKQLKEQSYIQTISLNIPGEANGTKIRFTFDNVTNAANSKLYIEGIFNLKNKTLEGVTYYGLTSTSGTTVQGTVDGIFVSFTFEGITTDSKQTVSRDYINEWTYISSTEAWQINSEFDRDQNTDIIVEEKSAAIMLVLDCSSSLGDQFSTMQNSAKSFINTLVNGSEEDDNGSGSGNNNVSGEPFDIFASLSYDDMVYVEGGTFLMGAQSSSSSSSNYDSGAYSDESPVHSVTLSSYYIGKYEVTQQLWEYVMNYTGTAADGSTMTAVATDPWLGDSNPSSTYGKGNYYPAYFVSYNDIVDYFIPRLNKITGKTFRLPTEAEWEYAARGGNQSKGYKYSGSNAIGDVAWYYGNASKTTHPVGTKSPNELGIYDMSGNVWEWCSDWYGSYSSTAQTNPTGASSGSDRVDRGGSWHNDAHYCRVPNRSYYNPSYGLAINGFRLLYQK